MRSHGLSAMYVQSPATPDGVPDSPPNYQSTRGARPWGRSLTARRPRPKRLDGPPARRRFRRRSRCGDRSCATPRHAKAVHNPSNADLGNSYLYRAVLSTRRCGWAVTRGTRLRESASRRVATPRRGAVNEPPPQSYSLHVLPRNSMLLQSLFGGCSSLRSSTSSMPRVRN